MELRHYTSFVAVAEELHFRRAAERLHVSQPPLSRRISQLEAELGVQLFERTSRRVALTAAGEAFLDEARRVLAAVDRSITTVRRVGAGEIGRLALGFVASAVADLLPHILHRFRSVAPDVEVELRELTTKLQIEALTAGTIDVGIARDLDDGEGLACVPIRTEPLIAALPAGHRLAATRVIQLAELADEPFIVLPRASIPRVHDHVLSLCRTAGFSPTVAQEAQQFPTILSLVEAQIGIAIVPEPVRQFRTTGVAYVGLEDDGATSTVQLVHRADTNAPIVDRFVREAVRSEEPKPDRMPR